MRQGDCGEQWIGNSTHISTLAAVFSAFIEAYKVVLVVAVAMVRFGSGITMSKCSNYGALRTVVLTLFFVSLAVPALAVESTARSSARGSAGGNPLSDFSEQQDMSLVTASAAVNGAEGSAQASVTADAVHGTIRFSSSSSGFFGRADVFGALTEEIALEVLGATPATQTNFLARFYFDGTASADPIAGTYLINLRTGISGTNITSAVLGGINTFAFDDGQFQDPLRPPFAPFGVDMHGVITGPTAMLYLLLDVTAEVTGNAQTQFGSTLGFQLFLPPGVNAVTTTTGAAPLYGVVPLPAGMVLVAPALIGLAASRGARCRMENRLRKTPNKNA